MTQASHMALINAHWIYNKLPYYRTPESSTQFDSFAGTWQRTTSLETSMQVDSHRRLVWRCPSNREPRDQVWNNKRVQSRGGKSYIGMEPMRILSSFLNTMLSEKSHAQLNNLHTKGRKHKQTAEKATKLKWSETFSQESLTVRKNLVC